MTTVNALIIAPNFVWLWTLVISFIYRQNQTYGTRSVASPANFCLKYGRSGRCFRTCARLRSAGTARCRFRQDRADPALRVVLPVSIHLDVRLQHDTLGEQELVFGLQPQRGAAGLADIARGLDVEPIRRQVIIAKLAARGARAGRRANAESCG